MKNINNRLAKLEGLYGARHECPACGWKPGDPVITFGDLLRHVNDHDLQLVEEIFQESLDREQRGEEEYGPRRNRRLYELRRAQEDQQPPGQPDGGGDEGR